jgi:hypothetical protein
MSDERLQSLFIGPAGRLYSCLSISDLKSLQDGCRNVRFAAEQSRIEDRKATSTPTAEPGHPSPQGRE